MVKSQEYEIKSASNNPPLVEDMGGLADDADLLPESLRDLDLNREGFEAEALKLNVGGFRAVIKSDNLICRSEDHVLDLTLRYIDNA